MEESALSEAHEKDVRPWLDLIDSLRQHGIHHDLPLPQIAVVGDQSSGKSSVLEAISGVPFPRGTGLVTRCAIQLIMKRAPPNTPWRGHASVSWKLAQPKESGPISSADEIPNIIVALTNHLTNYETSSFSSESIIIKVTSPDAPDLTLIDLPGIVRTSTSGQSHNVIDEVNNLIQSYIQQPRTIILAVVPSNQDVATVDILERARVVDPQGVRTIGVLTKPDLVGDGNEQEVIKVLTNTRKPLRLGYVMVKNRSQKEIENGVTYQQAKENESMFFSNHLYFSRLSKSFFGVENLTKRLTTVLVQRIQASLPAIKWELQSSLEKTIRELKPLGQSVPSSLGGKRTALMKLMSDYAMFMRQTARGYYLEDIFLFNPQLRLFGEYQKIFRQLQSDVLATEPGFKDSNFEEKIKKTVFAMRGREMPGFLNSQVFFGFIIENVDSWHPAVNRCRSDIITITHQVTAQLIEVLAPQFPQLCSKVQGMVSTIIERRAEELTSKIDDIFTKESDPFTTNESMLLTVNAIREQKFSDELSRVMQRAGDKPDSVETLKSYVKEALGSWYMKNHGIGTDAQVQDMITLLQAYWNVATKRVVDNICMTIEQDFLMNLLMDLEHECVFVAQLNTQVESFLIEDSNILERRKHLEEKKERLEKGLESIRRMAPTTALGQNSEFQEEVKSFIDRSTEQPHFSFDSFSSKQPVISRSSSLIIPQTKIPIQETNFQTKRFSTTNYDTPQQAQFRSQPPAQQSLTTPGFSIPQNDKSPNQDEFSHIKTRTSSTPVSNINKVLQKDSPKANVVSSFQNNNNTKQEQKYDSRFQSEQRSENKNIVEPQIRVEEQKKEVQTDRKIEQEEIASSATEPSFTIAIQSPFTNAETTTTIPVSAVQATASQLASAITPENIEAAAKFVTAPSTIQTASKVASVVSVSTLEPSPVLEPSPSSSSSTLTSVSTSLSSSGVTKPLPPGRQKQTSGRVSQLAGQWEKLNQTDSNDLFGTSASSRFSQNKTQQNDQYRDLFGSNDTSDQKSLFGQQPKPKRGLFDS